MTNFNDVGDFHVRFGLPRSGRPGGQPDFDPELMTFRIKFMEEELDEFTEAVDQGDHAGAFDALIDLVYVAMGTAHFLNYPWERGWDEVQRANMTKVRAQSAEESKRGSTFDVVKPAGWQAPDLQRVLDADDICPVCNNPREGRRCRAANPLTTIAYCQSNGYFKEVR